MSFFSPVLKKRLRKYSFEMCFRKPRNWLKSAAAQRSPQFTRVSPSLQDMALAQDAWAACSFC